MQAHDAQRLLKDACSLAVQASSEDQSNWACMREDMYADAPADVNTYRHLRIADFSDTVSALPPEELQVSLPDCCQTWSVLAAMFVFILAHLECLPVSSNVSV